MAVLLVALPSLLEGQPSVQYAYDAAGRLIAVSDQDGNTAIYVYDPAGNLLQIDRVTAEAIQHLAIAITAVSPNRGRRGVSVTILGKGFGPTPSQNVVSFNGTAANVLSASPNRLAVTVPGGATTGPITVTAPLGSAASPTSFTVLGAITVSPVSGTIFTGNTRQFAAQENGRPTTTALWAVTGPGTISAAGLYRAPALLPAATLVTITARHPDDPTLSASATLAVLTPVAIDRSVTGAVSVAVASPPVNIDKSVTSAVSVAVASPPVNVDKSVTTAIGVAVASPPLNIDQSVMTAVAVSLQPVVTHLTPSTAAPGTTGLVVTLSGVGFSSDLDVAVLRNNLTDPDITVSDVTVDPTGIEATITLSVSAAAPVGARVLKVSTPEGASTTLGTSGNLFTVQ